MRYFWGVWGIEGREVIKGEVVRFGVGVKKRLGEGSEKVMEDGVGRMCVVKEE